MRSLPQSQNRPFSRLRRPASLRRGPAAAGVVLSIILTLVFASTASAQRVGTDDIYRSGPDFVWDVQTIDTNTTHARFSRALIYDLEELNGRVYAAGQFLEARSPQGAIVRRPYLAAFNVDTGALITEFQPSLEAPALSLDTYNGQLLVGGEFPGGLRLLNATTGARISSFNPNFTNFGTTRPAVWDIDVVGNSLYVGGSFNRAGGVSLDNLARLNLPSGSVDSSWRPRTIGVADGTRNSGGKSVYGIAVDNSRGRVYVAGRFDRVNNNAEADNFAIVATSNGQVITSLPQGPPRFAINHDQCENDGRSCMEFDNHYLDVQFEGDRVYIGGEGHTTIRMRASDLRVLDFTHTQQAVGDLARGGDTQVIHIGRDTVWSGCHCFGSVDVFGPLSELSSGEDYRAFTREFMTTDRQSVRAIFGQNKSDGRLRPQVFDLSGQAGSFALLEDSRGRLWSGGQYESGGGRRLTGLARYSRPGDVGGGATPVAPSSCTATVQNGGIRIDWNRANNDNADSFVVRRSRDNGSFFWAGRTGSGTTSFSDTRTSVGASYRYTVEAQRGTARSATRACTPNPIVFGGASPVAPSSCRVSLSGNSIQVSWTRAANDNAERFVVRRSRNGGNFFWANRTNAPGTAWTDTNTSPGSSYRYTVETQAGGNRSTTRSCTPNPIVAGGGPARPASCSVSVVNGSVRVTWVRGANDAGDSAVVRRSRNGGSFFWANRTSAPATSWTDSNVSSGSAYSYTVESRSGGTSSATRTCSPSPVRP